MKLLLLLSLLIISCKDMEPCKDAMVEYAAARGVRKFICEELALEAPKRYAKRKCYYAKLIEERTKEMAQAICD